MSSEISLQMFLQRLFGGQFVFLVDQLQLWKLQTSAENELNRKAENPCEKLSKTLTLSQNEVGPNRCDQQSPFFDNYN